MRRLSTLPPWWWKHGNTGEKRCDVIIRSTTVPALLLSIRLQYIPVVAVVTVVVVVLVVVAASAVVAVVAVAVIVSTVIFIRPPLVHCKVRTNSATSSLSLLTYRSQPPFQPILSQPNSFPPLLLKKRLWRQRCHVLYPCQFILSIFLSILSDPPTPSLLGCGANGATNQPRRPKIIVFSQNKDYMSSELSG